MKMFGKTKDGAIDNLLRAHVARADGPTPLCKEFDPDLANAYIEHSLTASARGRYEQHLSLCASCRKSVIALARMADTDFSLAEVKSRKLIVESEPRWKIFLGAIPGPQWAMAAAAIIVLAISLPLLLSRKDAGVNQSANEVGTPQTQSSGDTAIAGKVEPGSTVDNVAAGAAAQPVARATSVSQDKPAAKPADEANSPAKEDKESPAEKSAGEASGLIAKAETPQPQPVESKNAAQNTNQAAPKESNRNQADSQAGAPPTQQAASESQLAKINPEEARRLPQESKDKAQVSVLVPGRADGPEQRKKEATIGPGSDIAPPPPPSASDSKASKGLRLNYRDSRDAENERHANAAGERKIGKKRFWLRDDMWVDKEYNPNKELPVVTIIRDSDVYKELLAKRAGMKLFLLGFTEADRVMFVYKGTVYKLIPQDGNK